MQRFHRVAGVSRTEPVTGRQPRRERGQCLARRLQLAERDAQCRTGKTPVWECKGGRFTSGPDGLDNMPLERDEIRVAVTLKEGLEGGVAVVPKWTPLAELVAERVRGIEMRAGDPAFGQWFGRRMSSPMRQQFWQDMSMRPVGAFAVWRRDRLEHLSPRDAADEHTVRIGRQDDAHRIVAWRKHGLSCAAPKCSDNRRIIDANASVYLQDAEAEIEQNAVAILTTQCVTVRANFREHLTPAHDAGAMRKAQRYPMAPALGGGRF